MIFSASPLLPMPGIPGVRPAAPGGPPPAPPATADDKILKQVMEGLVYLIRGDEGLNLPAEARTQLKVIYARAKARLGAKVFPVITPTELRAVYTLTAQAAPSVFDWMFYRRALQG